MKNYIVFLTFVILTIVQSYAQDNVLSNRSLRSLVDPTVNCSAARPTGYSTCTSDCRGRNFCTNGVLTTTTSCPPATPFCNSTTLACQSTIGACIVPNTGCTVGFSADLKNCRTYSYCDGTYSYSYTCAVANSVFDPARNYCRIGLPCVSYSNTTGCSGRTNQLVPYGLNNTMYVFCGANNQQLLLSCGVNSTFNPITKNCQYKCSVPGRFPDYTNSSYYYNCAKSGITIIATRVMCSEGTLFDIVNNVCAFNAQTISSVGSGSSVTGPGSSSGLPSGPSSPVGSSSSGSTSITLLPSGAGVSGSSTSSTTTSAPATSSSSSPSLPAGPSNPVITSRNARHVINPPPAVQFIPSAASRVSFIPPDIRDLPGGPSNIITLLPHPVISLPSVVPSNPHLPAGPANIISLVPNNVPSVPSIPSVAAGVDVVLPPSGDLPIAPSASGVLNLPPGPALQISRKIRSEPRLPPGPAIPIQLVDTEVHSSGNLPAGAPSVNANFPTGSPKSSILHKVADEELAPGTKQQGPPRVLPGGPSNIITLIPHGIPSINLPSGVLPSIPSKPHLPAGPANIISLVPNNLPSVPSIPAAAGGSSGIDVAVQLSAPSAFPIAPTASGALILPPGSAIQISRKARSEPRLPPGPANPIQLVDTEVHSSENLPAGAPSVNVKFQAGSPKLASGNEELPKQQGSPRVLPGGPSNVISLLPHGIPGINVPINLPNINLQLPTDPNNLVSLITSNLPSASVNLPSGGNLALLPPGPIVSPILPSAPGLPPGPSIPISKKPHSEPNPPPGSAIKLVDSKVHSSSNLPAGAPSVNLPVGSSKSLTDSVAGEENVPKQQPPRILPGGPSNIISLLPHGPSSISLFPSIAVPLLPIGPANLISLVASHIPIPVSGSSTTKPSSTTASTPSPIVPSTPGTSNLPPGPSSQIGKMNHPAGPSDLNSQRFVRSTEEKLSPGPANPIQLVTTEVHSSVNLPVGAPSIPNLSVVVNGENLPAGPSKPLASHKGVKNHGGHEPSSRKARSTKCIPKLPAGPASFISLLPSSNPDIPSTDLELSSDSACLCSSSLLSTSCTLMGYMSVANATTLRLQYTGFRVSCIENSSRNKHILYDCPKKLINCRDTLEDYVSGCSFTSCDSDEGIIYYSCD